MLGINNQIQSAKITPSKNFNSKKTIPINNNQTDSFVKSSAPAFKGYSIKGGFLGDVSKHLTNVKTYDELTSNLKLNTMDKIKSIFKGKYIVSTNKKAKALFDHMSTKESQKSIAKALDEIQNKVKKEPYKVISDSPLRTIAQFKKEPVLLEVYEPHFGYGENSKYMPNFSVILKNTETKEDIVLHAHNAETASKAFNLTSYLNK